jgi:23S rRNA (guanosine2251-2'-O)-methyltransferase
VSARVVVGLQPVREAIRVHGAAVDRVVLETGGGPRLDALGRFARDHGVADVRTASRGELDRLGGGVRHQGVAALCPELRLTPLASLDLGPSSLLVALDGIMDPQNFGAVIRSAVALGATAVVWPEHSSAPLSPATFRASAGAIEHATLCRVGSLPGALSDAASRGLSVVGLDAAAQVELSGVDLRGGVAIVIGAEDTGLRKSVRRACTCLARLPMRGSIDSLNASVASALALYEVVRQRGNGNGNP